MTQEDMQAHGVHTPREQFCEHGVRWPHECKDCEAETGEKEIALWAAQEARLCLWCHKPYSEHREDSDGPDAKCPCLGRRSGFKARDGALAAVLAEPEKGPQDEAPRFGNRLREAWLPNTALSAEARGRLLAMADAIDADAVNLAGTCVNEQARDLLAAELKHEGLVARIRAKVEAAVEQLCEPVARSGGDINDLSRLRSMVDSKRLLAALAEIFGEPAASTKLVTLRKEDCAPLLVPEDRLADFAEAGWFPEEKP